MAAAFSTPLKRRSGGAGAPYGRNTIGRTFTSAIYSENLVRFSTGGVYVLSPPGYTTAFKIGYSMNLARRLKSYCTYYPNSFRIYMVAYGGITTRAEGRRAEKRVHDYLTSNDSFAQKAACGDVKGHTEWFNVKGGTNRVIVSELRNALAEAGTDSVADFTIMPRATSGQLAY